MPAQQQRQQKPHACEHCGQPFKREEHLVRHKLSHGAAQFQCSHHGCGMTFHRKDVLQRHEKVHGPNDANVRRRRPRRGVVPKPFISSAKRAAFVHARKKRANHDNAEGERLPEGQEEEDASSPFSASWVLARFGDDEVLDGLPVNVLALCASHFTRAGMETFSFIHRTSLDDSSVTVVPERFLAMAVIGGSALPEHKAVVKLFFERAKKLFEQRQERLLVAGGRPVSAAHNPNTKAALGEELYLFQAQLLMIEYGLWHARSDYKYWPGQLMFGLANDLVPRMVTYVQENEQAAVNDWSEWIYQEQCVRALWALYCTTQKSRLLSPCPFSSLSVQSGLRLPSSNMAFDAQSEEEWQQALDLSLRALHTVVPTFEVAFYRLLLTSHGSGSSTTADHEFLGLIGQLGRHVLLSALLDQYLSSTTVASNFDSLDAYCTRDLAHWAPRGVYMRTLATCKKLWWTDPVILLAYPVARPTVLQNSILISYMEVLMYGGGGMDSSGSGGAKVSRTDYSHAVKVAMSLVAAMAEGSIAGLSQPWWPSRRPTTTTATGSSDSISPENNASLQRFGLEEKAVADGACEYFMFELASLALRWCRTLQTKKKHSAVVDTADADLHVPLLLLLGGQDDNNDDDDDDYNTKQVVMHGCTALAAFREKFSDAEIEKRLDLDDDDVESLEDWLCRASSVILTVRNWLDLK